MDTRGSARSRGRWDAVEAQEIGPRIGPCGGSRGCQGRGFQATAAVLMTAPEVFLDVLAEECGSFAATSRFPDPRARPGLPRGLRPRVRLRQRLRPSWAR